ncbi:MAG: ABC transporter substrate-binding protein [Ancalomicrobiaceae bacterium]|nr:ABC transporter substrate-binding protein [Ancalomicrobiaceae bacterium]
MSGIIRGTCAALAFSTALAASAASAGQVVYWSMWNQTEPQAIAIKKIMDAYTAAHPETTFSVVWNGRQNQTKLRTALQGGIKVDLMDQDSDQLAGGLQKQGLARDVSGDLTAETKAALLPGTLELFAEGKAIYQVPYIYNTVNIWYNKDLLAAAGGKIPATYDDLLALCGKVRASDKYALVIEGNVAFYNVAYFSHYLERKLGMGALVKLFEDKSGASWKQPAVLEAAEAARALWDKECIAKDARGFQYPAGQQTIALGETFGELVGSWLPTELAESAGKDFHWGAFSYPAVKDGVGKATDLEVGLLSFMVLKAGPNGADAAKFVNYALSESAQKTIVGAGVGVVRKNIEWPAAVADAYKAASTATALGPFGGGLNISYPEFTSQVLNPEFNKMFLGETKPADFVEVLASKTKAYWDAH